MPEVAFRYAIDKSLADQHHIRAYGFHGTSHNMFQNKQIVLLKSSVKSITIHLAMDVVFLLSKMGKCIDHSLGFGPVNGLIMGTCSGDIDQSVIFYLAEKLNMSISSINNLLQRKELFGLTEFVILEKLKDVVKGG